MRTIAERSATCGSTAACSSACRPSPSRSQYGLVRGTPFGAALVALWCWPAFYVAAGRVDEEAARRSASPSRRALAIATVFLTLVIPFALDERSTAGAWTLEGARAWSGSAFASGAWLAARLRLRRCSCIAGFADAARPRALRHAGGRSSTPTCSMALMAAAASHRRRARSYIALPRQSAALRNGEEADASRCSSCLATLWLASAVGDRDRRPSSPLRYRARCD